MTQYLNQSHRGELGFGLISLSSTRATIVKTPDQQEIIEALFKHDSKNLIFHHRQPTSTENTKESAHPFSITIQDKIYHTVHNGVLYNHLDLYQRMRKTYTFESLEISKWNNQPTVNDSEVLAIDIAEVLSGQKAKLESTGWLAFITLITDLNYKPLEVVFGRHSAPLNIIHSPNSLWLASEGIGLELEEDLLYRFNLSTKKLTADASFGWPEKQKAWLDYLPGPKMSRRLQREVDIAEWDYENNPTDANAKRLDVLYKKIEDEALANIDPLETSPD